jgi:hypothetical protein
MPYHGRESWPPVGSRTACSKVSNFDHKKDCELSNFDRPLGLLFAKSRGAWRAEGGYVHATIIPTRWTVRTGNCGDE